MFSFACVHTGTCTRVPTHSQCGGKYFALHAPVPSHELNQHIQYIGILYIFFTLLFFIYLVTFFQGDLNKKAKHNQELEQTMKKLANDSDRVNLKQREEICSLEEEIQTINTNIQVIPRPVTVKVNF